MQIEGNDENNSLDEVNELSLHCGHLVSVQVT